MGALVGNEAGEAQRKGDSLLAGELGGDEDDGAIGDTFASDRGGGGDEAEERGDDGGGSGDGGGSDGDDEAYDDMLLLAARRPRLTPAELLLQRCQLARQMVDEPWRGVGNYDDGTAGRRGCAPRATPSLLEQQAGKRAEAEAEATRRRRAWQEQAEADAAAAQAAVDGASEEVVAAAVEAARRGEEEAKDATAAEEARQLAEAAVAVAETIAASMVAGVLQEAEKAEEARKLAVAARILRREQLNVHKSFHEAVKHKKMGDFRLAVKAEIMFMVAGDEAEERRESQRQLEREAKVLAEMVLAAEECVAAALDDVLALYPDAPEDAKT